MNELFMLNCADYEGICQVGKRKIKCYSPKQMESLHPDGNYTVIGEIGKNCDSPVANIKLAGEMISIAPSGFCGKSYKACGFIKTTDEAYIAIMKKKKGMLLLPIGLVAVLGIGAAVYFGTQKPADEIDPDLIQVDAPSYTVKGNVFENNVAMPDDKLSLQLGNEEKYQTVTDKNGAYLFNNVENNYYNMVTYNKDSVLTTLIGMENASVEQDVYFPAEEMVVKALVKIEGSNTPAIAVGGLDTEVLELAQGGKEIDLTMSAKAVETPDEAVKKLVEEQSGELELDYFDFNLNETVISGGKQLSSASLTETRNVLQLVIPFDTSSNEYTYVFWTDGKKLSEFKQVNEKPADKFKDGTFYVHNNYVIIYTNDPAHICIGSARNEGIKRGSSTMTYSSSATLNLTSGEISFLYEQSPDSTHAASVEIYLKGKNEDLLLAKSTPIEAGSKITSMKMTADKKKIPSVGSYEGLMKIVYSTESSESSAGTAVDIPLTVTITQ